MFRPNFIGASALAVMVVILPAIGRFTAEAKTVHQLMEASLLDCAVNSYPEAAAEKYSEILKANPNNVQALEGRAQKYIKLSSQANCHNDEKARVFYQKASEVDLDRLATLAPETGYYARACFYASDGQFFDDRDRLYKAICDFDRAIPYLEKDIHRFSQSSEDFRLARYYRETAYLTRGDCHIRTGQYKKALVDYHEILDWNEAIEHYNYRLSDFPDDPQAYLARAEAYEKSGKLKEAESDYRMAKCLSNRKK